MLQLFSVVTLLPVEDYHVSSQTSDSKEFTCLYQGDSEPGIGVTAGEPMFFVNDSYFSRLLCKMNKHFSPVVR